MEYCFFTFTIAVVLIWGWRFTKDLLKKQKEYSLYLVVKNQENCLEGIVRNLYRYLHKAEASLRLILLVEESQDQTWAIAQRLARNFSFDIQAITDLEQWRRNNPFYEDEKKLLLDVRNANKGWAEARKVRQYVLAIKGCQQIKQEEAGLGS